MAKNYLQPGNALTVTAPATVSGGDVVVIGSLIGIAAGDAASGAPLDIEVGGVWSLPKVAADDFSVGEIAYYDDATGLVTTTATDNVKIGIAVAAAANPSAAVKVRLNPAF